MYSPGFEADLIVVRHRMLAQAFVVALWIIVSVVSASAFGASLGRQQNAVGDGVKSSGFEQARLYFPG
jgi:hypothetical protein